MTWLESNEEISNGVSFFMKVANSTKENERIKAAKTLKFKKIEPVPQKVLTMMEFRSIL